MMEQRNNLVLQGTETFSRGQLDNLALENGSLVLTAWPDAACNTAATPLRNLPCRRSAT